MTLLSRALRQLRGEPEPVQPRDTQLTHEELRMLYDLRKRGFAVCVVAPSELHGADRQRVEDGMAMEASYAVEQHLEN